MSQPPVVLAGSVFQPPVVLAGSVFQSPVVLAGSVFQPPVVLAGSVFQHPVVLAGSVLLIPTLPSLLMEETRVPGENHQPVASHWQTFSHNIVLSTPRHERGSNSQLWWWWGLIAQMVVNPTTIRTWPRRPRSRFGKYVKTDIYNKYVVNWFFIMHIFVVYAAIVKPRNFVHKRMAYEKQRWNNKITK
jgi:hypothetical protein